VILDSDPEVENPSYRFFVFPVELLLLPFRLEAQQDSLTLPNGIFSTMASHLNKQLRKMIWEEMKTAFHF